MENRNTVHDAKYLVRRFPRAIRRTCWRSPDGTEWVASSHPAYHIDSWDECDGFLGAKKVWSLIRWGTPLTDEQLAEQIRLEEQWDAEYRDTKRTRMLRNKRQFMRQRS